MNLRRAFLGRCDPRVRVLVFPGLRAARCRCRLQAGAAEGARYCTDVKPGAVFASNADLVQDLADVGVLGADAVDFFERCQVSIENRLGSRMAVGPAAGFGDLGYLRPKLRRQALDGR